MGLTKKTLKSPRARRAPRRSLAKSRAAAIAQIGGQRIGTKKRDMRWQDPDGNVWASRFEYSVYKALKEQGYNVRRTTPQDSKAYTATVKNGECLECNSERVVTNHWYTPDLFVTTGPEGEPFGQSGYYIEAKGYLRAERRSLLRSFRKARPDVDFRLVVERDYKVGKGTLISWADKYLKVPVIKWDGKLPEDWNAIQD